MEQACKPLKRPYKTFVGKSEGKRPLVETGVDGRIIFIPDLKK
jgi:hypothetical protein